MTCKYFGLCASCTLYDKTYRTTRFLKVSREKQRFSNFTNIDF